MKCAQGAAGTTTTIGLKLLVSIAPTLFVVDFEGLLHYKEIYGHLNVPQNFRFDSDTHRAAAQQHYSQRLQLQECARDAESRRAALGDTYMTSEEPLLGPQVANIKFSLQKTKTS